MIKLYYTTPMGEREVQIDDPELKSIEINLSSGNVLFIAINDDNINVSTHAAPFVLTIVPKTCSTIQVS